MKTFSFAKIRTPIEIPDLLDMQKGSFEEFLQVGVPLAERRNRGLQAAMLDGFSDELEERPDDQKDAAQVQRAKANEKTNELLRAYLKPFIRLGDKEAPPMIKSSDESVLLVYAGYSVGEPKYTLPEAVIKDATYAAPIKVKLLLVHRDAGGRLKESPEQEVFLCDLPLMTENGTFVINGTERGIISQLHRSPGVFFEEDEERRITSFGKKLYYARMIPDRGAWVEFEFDGNNILYVRLDKRRKLHATTLLRAVGLEKDEEILRAFYEVEEVNLDHVKPEQLAGRIVARDVVDRRTGEILVEVNRKLTKDHLARMHEQKVKSLALVVWDPALNDVAIHLTLEEEGRKKTHIRTRKDAVAEIYRMMRGQEYLTVAQADSFFKTLLLKSIRKYDLTRVGRYKINKKLGSIFKDLGQKKGLGFEAPTDRKRTLTPEDIVATITYLVRLQNGVGGEVDDIDHLGNRRIRGVGELLENQIRSGLSNMARLVRERMNAQEKHTLTPRGILNTTPLVSIVRKFFGTSQLSQFMDQTNPLAELTHKRRLSALGPGGLHRKRAGFEVRDVHHTHYGRICPIETPEGPNIGLITSLACYARINEYGLIESPYRRVANGRVTEQIEYLTADREDEYVIAQANSLLDKHGKFASELVASRRRGDFPLVFPEDVDYIDISPMQVVSVSTAMIPFLEHDDANRALMGSNMQRQSVPLLLPERPLVATGIEARAARDSQATVTARRPGRVVRVTGDQIAVLSEDARGPGVDLYPLRKFVRSNQDTCINQVPLVTAGQKVGKGDVLADGPATSGGELALGRNVLVAFMAWEGYNFEDAILISERLVRDDVFTSIHIQEFQIEARDIKMGQEEITRDIPNVGEEALHHLDEHGIVRVGAVVQPGDLLVGKVTPKGEQQTTPEERLLKVIFGRKAEDVRDASLRVPPGVRGTVIDVRLFTRRDKSTRRGLDKDRRRIDAHFRERLESLHQQRREQINGLNRAVLLRRISELEKSVGANLEKIGAEVVKSAAARLREYQTLERMMEGEVRESAKDLLVLMKKIVLAIRTEVTSAVEPPAGRKGLAGSRSPGGSKDLARFKEQMERWRETAPAALVEKVSQALAEAEQGLRQIASSAAGQAAARRDLERRMEGLKKVRIQDEKLRLMEYYRALEQDLKVRQAEEIAALTSGDELPVTVNKLVKVYIAAKRKIQVGDKMAGRHGNKGVVSKILPMEDMPHLPDGTPVDMCLSPLSVPSRMNVGQILEVMLGWAGRHLETQMISPVFDGASEEEVIAKIREAKAAMKARGVPESFLPTDDGKFWMRDGRNGEAFHEPVTVGQLYILKLAHLVEDKIHARSTGPYSLITRQPLGGKAQFGGQRFGEMEVWAIEGYGAAYTLQEFLTVKSDDVTGRTKMYEALIKGGMVSEPGVPESFKVLVNELRGLGLNVELLSSGAPKPGRVGGAGGGGTDGGGSAAAGRARAALAAPVKGDES